MLIKLDQIEQGSVIRDLIKNLKEDNAVRGASAFELANKVREEAGEEPFSSEAEFIESLKGPDGTVDATDEEIDAILDNIEED